MMDIYKKLREFGKVRTNEPMSKHTTFKIGGEVQFFVSVAETDNLVQLLKYLDENGMAYMIVGGGSNMLASDMPFDGVVIEVRTREKAVDGDIIIADAGCITVDIAQFSMANGLAGFEWGVGVPGTIGGAVRGNAGAMGKEMNDDLHKVEVYRDGEVIELSNEECEFDYRDSVFKHSTDVVLRVWLQLEKSENKSGMKKALEFLSYRNKTQPQGFPSTGCVFKNPDTEKHKEQLLNCFDENDEKVRQFLKVGKISAGWLVEQAGMKRKRIGGAEVSDRHGNFILNVDNATSSDVQQLIEEIKEAVYTQYHIPLEEEIHIM